MVNATVTKGEQNIYVQYGDVLRTTDSVKFFNKDPKQIGLQKSYNINPNGNPINVQYEIVLLSTNEISK